VFVRISATDCLDGESWTVEDSARLAEPLAEAGADLIDVSSGGIGPDSAPGYTGPNYQLRWAERIRADSPIPVGTVGGITAPEQAEAVIANDRADLAILGREHLRDPYFTMTAAKALDATEQLDTPPQYRRGWGF
jgi:2,4-dienoyl-CoA reductase-like NADH-dependent reductase (Old Yellow Enzyme family)